MYTGSILTKSKSNRDILKNLLNSKEIRVETMQKVIKMEDPIKNLLAYVGPKK
jgi:hypothetical protein